MVPSGWSQQLSAKPPPPGRTFSQTALQSTVHETPLSGALSPPPPQHVPPSGQHSESFIAIVPVLHVQLPPLLLLAPPLLVEVPPLLLPPLLLVEPPLLLVDEPPLLDVDPPLLVDPPLENPPLLLV